MEFIMKSYTKVSFIITHETWFLGFIFNIAIFHSTCVIYNHTKLNKLNKVRKISFVANQSVFLTRDITYTINCYFPGNFFNLTKNCWYLNVFIYKQRHFYSLMPISQSFFDTDESCQRIIFTKCWFMPPSNVLWS